jgi:outer membrane biosynthesis protein TonB
VFVLFFTLLYKIADKTPTVLKPKESRIKIDLKQIKPKPIKQKKSGKIKKPPPPPKIAPPMPKGKQLKKLVKKPLIKYEEKKITKVKKKEKPKYAWLKEDLQDDEVMQKIKKDVPSSSISNNLKEAYGDEFGKLTQGQKKYILDNQDIMRRITQQILTRVASVNLMADMNVNKANLIEFYLHPNGDMTDFKFINKSGYYVLDDTTKETIEYAYSRYPRPKEKILIRYIIYYNLARY